MIRPMTPKKILIFIASVFFILLILSVVFPKNGIKLPGKISLNFIDFEDLINPPKQQKKDISDILELTNLSEKEDTSAFEIKNNSQFDSVMIDSQYVYYDPVPIRIDSVVRYIEFPDNSRSSLDRFFEILATIKNENKIVRIMHYGDSQIETDRITDYFRYKLQTQFGGVGPGLVPAVKAFDFKSPMIHTFTGNWKRYTVYGRKDTSVRHNKFGMLGSFSRFTPITSDTAKNYINNDALMPHKLKSYAQITITQSPYSFITTKQYQRCKMFYGNNKSPFKVKVYKDDILLSDETVDTVKNYSVKTWNLNTAPENLRFEFEAEDSPDIYGFSLEGLSGINVDNIGMRGSGGIIFTLMNLSMLSQMYQQLNTKLLILQFGGNIVPGEQKNYDFYRKSFSRQLKTIKKIAPDISILIIGLADMSKKEDELYVSYPNIKLIRDALKQAGFENDCAYWDMYEAMGGENSMPSWVFHDPPLGEKDFTHFTPQGARYISKMFYNAFMYEYNNYLKRRK